ncbi:ABC transporter [Colletotrichum tofieldiae]|nr:ABC transporter [Colletotrichum tofieldiae]
MVLFSLYCQIHSGSETTASYGHMVRAVGYANGVRRAPLWIAYTLFDFFFVSTISAAITAHLGSKMPLWTGGTWVMLPILAL